MKNPRSVNWRGQRPKINPSPVPGTRQVSEFKSYAHSDERQKVLNRIEIFKMEASLEYISSLLRKMS